jgi:apolipoprotein N-acyltransferase
VQFVLKDPHAKVAPLICFEDMFPHYTREYVEDDTDFLLNLTNDGWFGESSEQWQHAMNALFRAVENGVPLVRCTNNGLTCWIDEFGRVRQIFRGPSGSIHEPGYLIAHIPLQGDVKRPPTFYRQHGDVFGWVCVALAVLILVNSRLRKTAPVA